MSSKQLYKWCTTRQKYLSAQFHISAISFGHRQEIYFPAASEAMASTLYIGLFVSKQFCMLFSRSA